MRMRIARHRPARPPRPGIGPQVARRSSLSYVVEWGNVHYLQREAILTR
jgi:hypothetical protein